MTQTQELQDRITALRKLRGAAKLDGKKFDGTAIAAVEAEIAAADDAEAERVRRQREEAEGIRKELVAALKKQKAHLCDKYLENVLAANMAAGALGEALSSAVSIGAEIVTIEHQITGESAPIVMSKSELASRLSNRLAAKLRYYLKSRFGGLWLQGGGFYDPKHDWQAEEAEILAKHLNHGKVKPSDKAKYSKERDHDE